MIDMYKISAWNRETGDVSNFEVNVGKIEEYGVNGIVICDTDLKRVAGVIMMIKRIVDIEFSLIYNSCFGEFVECHITTFDGNIDINK